MEQKLVLIEPNIRETLGRFTNLFEVVKVNNDKVLNQYHAISSYRKEENLQSAIDDGLNNIIKQVSFNLIDKICSIKNNVDKITYGNKPFFVLSKKEPSNEYELFLPYLPNNIKQIVLLHKPYLYLWKQYPDVLLKMVSENDLDYKLNFVLIAETDIVGDAFIIYDI